MALDLSPTILFGPEGNVRLNLTNEEEISIQGIFLYFCYYFLLFSQSKKCVYSFSCCKTSQICIFPNKSSLNLQVNDCFNIHPEEWLWLSAKRAEVLASSADRRKRRRRSSGRQPDRETGRRQQQVCACYWSSCSWPWSTRAWISSHEAGFINECL